MGSVQGKVVSVMGPNNYQINSLGKMSGNDQQLRLGFFREGGFPENACIGGAISERNL